ncbi:hypothetical protein CRG98_042108 [Punica granatum]|uniref:Uncharacterized protein n=1 Tax=Punica granatum TaxID=22663 RepID=A0A2I0I180_PUNGR|nr:hypothetical protein CRG98_042108 [Punica granatum]
MLYHASRYEERVGEVFESRVTWLNAWKGAQEQRMRSSKEGRAGHRSTRGARLCASTVHPRARWRHARTTRKDALDCTGGRARWHKGTCARSRDGDWLRGVSEKLALLRKVDRFLGHGSPCRGERMKVAVDLPAKEKAINEHASKQTGSSPNPLRMSPAESPSCAHPNFNLVGARMRAYATRIGSVHLSGDARRTRVRRSHHLLFTTCRSRAVESPGSRGTGYT